MSGKRPHCCDGDAPAAVERACHESVAAPQSKPDKLFWGSLLGVVSLYLLYTLASERVVQLAWLETLSHTVYQMVHMMWWGVLLGLLTVGLLSKIPREFILAILGRGGSVQGLLRATAAGVLLDLCSHGILMVGAKLYERGASAGQVVAFLLASPWNSFSLTLILIGLIGPKWTLLFIALSAVIALSTGYLFDRWVDSGRLPDNPNQTEMASDFRFWDEASKGLAHTRFDRRFFTDVLTNGLRGSKMVLRWLLFGILLAALLRAVFEPAQFEQFFGPTLVGTLVTLFVATVLEVCSEGSTPIAADILNRANAPGNGFAFLMAGVATDYTEILVLRETANSWRLALSLPLLAVPQIVLVAWLINIAA